MAERLFKLGPAIATPADFTPTQTITTKVWRYRLDIRRRLVSRQPINQTNLTPICFFALIPTDNPVLALHRSGLGSTLKRGIVIPTLISGLLAGLFLILYPLYPGVQFQVQKRLTGFSNNLAIAAPDPTHNRLIIPKIGVNTTILEGPSLAVLNRHDGVWHQRGNILGDNFVLAGHRFKYLPPNTSTFYNLSQLQTGDTVVIDWYAQRYIYTISVIERVNQHDNAILAPTTKTQLTLYTCYDRRQTERIVVIARLQP